MGEENRHYDALRVKVQRARGLRLLNDVEWSRKELPAVVAQLESSANANELDVLDAKLELARCQMGPRQRKETVGKDTVVLLESVVERLEALPNIDNDRVARAKNELGFALERFGEFEAAIGVWDKLIAGFSETDACCDESRRAMRNRAYALLRYGELAGKWYFQRGAEGGVSLTHVAL